MVVDGQNSYLVLLDSHVQVLEACGHGLGSVWCLIHHIIVMDNKLLQSNNQHTTLIKVKILMNNNL